MSEKNVTRACVCLCACWCGLHTVHTDDNYTNEITILVWCVWRMNDEFRICINTYLCTYLYLTRQTITVCEYFYNYNDTDKWHTFTYASRIPISMRFYDFKSRHGTYRIQYTPKNSTRAPCMVTYTGVYSRFSVYRTPFYERIFPLAPIDLFCGGRPRKIWTEFLNS